MGQLKSSLGVWDNEKGWVKHPSHDQQSELTRVHEVWASSAGSSSESQNEQDLPTEQTRPMMEDDVPPALIVREELLQELDRHPKPSADFPRTKRRRCSEDISCTVCADRMSIVLADHERDNYALMNGDCCSDSMVLEDLGIATNKEPISSLLDGHAESTRLLFPADRLDHFREVALARGAVRC